MATIQNEILFQLTQDIHQKCREVQSVAFLLVESNMKQSLITASPADLIILSISPSLSIIFFMYLCLLIHHFPFMKGCGGDGGADEETEACNLVWVWSN